ncbi:hypothetical protein LDL08_08295 [Nonomuraea glycinis]|uniref:hypothetical protein n=1 Tax=Nonomuraea glycinis TaxID=2047744 RepID=UPI001664D28A|nr:hypothetical protein [Nonomuraea glycinis]MCA2176178.1 hypothetical protein [Nonomuraea glycinis]
MGRLRRRAAQDRAVPGRRVLLEARLADGSDPVENVCALVLGRRRVLVVTAAPSGDLAGWMIEARSTRCCSPTPPA